MKYDIEIQKSFLTQKLRRVIAPLVALLTVLGLTFLGYQISPQNEDGKPILLSPRVAQIANYQRQVRTWASELGQIQAGLDTLLSSSPVDLLALDSQVSIYYGQLIRLHEEVDGTQAPPTLTALHDAVVDALNACLDAAASTATWVSAPTGSNQSLALDALQKASDLLKLVDQNPWVSVQP